MAEQQQIRNNRSPQQRQHGARPNPNRQFNNNRPRPQGPPREHREHSGHNNDGGDEKYEHPGMGARVQKRRPPTRAKTEQLKTIPSLEGETVRVITLGGVEEVGRNMFAVEYKDNIYVFDAGFQFVSETDAPGIDYTLPNTSYLEERRHKIKALIITHGHLDHIGGIPFLMDRLGNPPIYTRNLTGIMIQKRMELK
jgi:hypothetical protein